MAETLRLERLQNFQCFTLSIQHPQSVPWLLLDSILSSEIMTFNHNLHDLHSSLHEHGNAIYNYMVQQLLRRDEEAGLRFNITGLNIKYRHVWMEVNDFHISPLHRGQRWYDSRELCEEHARQNPQPGILTVETACQCYISEQCVGTGCHCLCHCRPCTHELNEFTPFLSNCYCTSAIRHKLDCGEVVCRAPYTKRHYHNTQFVFYLEKARYWFTSDDRNPAAAYRHHLISQGSQQSCSVPTQTSPIKGTC